MEEMNYRIMEMKLHRGRVKGVFLTIWAGLFIAITVMVATNLLEKFNDSLLYYKVAILGIFFIIFSFSFNFYIRVVSFLDLNMENMFFSYLAFIPNILFISLIKYDHVLSSSEHFSLSIMVPVSLVFILIKGLNILYLFRKRIKQNNIEFNSEVVEDCKKAQKFLLRVIYTLVGSLVVSLLIYFNFSVSDFKWSNNEFRYLGWLLFGITVLYIILRFTFYIWHKNFNGDDMQKLLVHINSINNSIDFGEYDKKDGSE